ncbi:hypothetical protein GGI20_000970 [Coemansia sp. BCRC 34301]|nr:hypothetical protein GGI20_000970 [Coemansia sp. BCRC 34301]
MDLVTNLKTLGVLRDAVQRLSKGSSVPLTAMLSALVVPAFASLLRWLAFELESEDGGGRADALRELLASTLAHLPRAAAISTVLGAVQTTFEPKEEEAAQRCVPVDALLDVLASDQVRSIIGDVFMTLLREQGALLDLLRGGVADDSLPRKWWLVSQTTMSMVDSLGPRVLASHVDVLSFVLATMQKESDDDNEGAEMLLAQMMDTSQETTLAALASSMGDLGRDAGPVVDPLMPLIVWDEVALDLLRRIYAQTKRLAEDSAAPTVVAKQASSAKLRIALVLALHGETHSSKEPTTTAFEPDNVDVTRFNTAIHDVRSDLAPVQAHGIIELRSMVLAKSPALVRTERLDAVIAVFTEMARNPDSYIYLNAIRGLAAMADSLGSRFVPLLAQMYTDQGVPLEDRLRVGEALQMTVSRAGPTLAQYAEHVVPRLLAAIDFSVDEEVITHSALAVLAAVARACPLALQKWVAEITPTIDTILMLLAAPPVVRRTTVIVWVDLLRSIDLNNLDSRIALRQTTIATAVVLTLAAVSGAVNHVVRMNSLPGYQLRVGMPTLCKMDVKQLSGYLDTASDKHFFFWFFEARKRRDCKTPLAVWLNGGPGCSSMMGALTELGPCLLSDDGNSTVGNPYAWNENAHLLFIDQPTNVGYSYGSVVNSTMASAADFYALVQLFYKRFPQYGKGDLHLFGESYAGKYIPAMGRRILELNKQVRRQRPGTRGQRVLPLASVAIGNGFVNPRVQFKYVSQMACNSTYPPVLTQDVCRQMDADYPQCARKIDLCFGLGNTTAQCEDALDFCESRIDYRLSIVDPTINPYDVRRKCEYPPLCYKFASQANDYLAQPSVQRALGAKQSSDFQVCSRTVQRGFVKTFDILRSFENDVAGLLDKGVRALFYNGDADSVCSWYGTKAMLTAMQWHGRRGFVRARDHIWTVASKAAGEVREHDGLSFIRVFDSGHLVPRDQPANALAMINRWLSKRPF